MDIAPDIAVAIIVAFAIYPFAVFGLAARISKHNARSFCFVSGLVAAGAIGCVLATVFLSTHGISKYANTDAIFGLVFTLAAAATGALIGALCDRWIRPNQSPNSPSKG